MFPVRYELGFCIAKDDGILHSHCCQNLKAYIIHVIGIFVHRKYFIISVVF
jgi:hypothetical protein